MIALLVRLFATKHPSHALFLRHTERRCTMINAILDRLGFGNSNSNRMTNALNDLTSVLRRDKTLADRFKRSDVGASLRSAGKSARGAALSTRSYATAHPRQIGLGLGAAALAAVALYALTRANGSKENGAIEPLPRSQKDS